MKIKSNELDSFARELSFSSEYRVLDNASDKEELIKIAEKTGLALPSPDMAIFKCKYAFTDQRNKNGCKLPKEEVAKSLNTLAHKPIDIDHLRKNVIGHYLYAELIDDTIYAYGSIYKDNFKEEFAELEALMNKGMLKTSFEAWGTKEPIDNRTYELKDIVWAGGGLLVDTEPAFSEAGVMEMAKKRVLEFAKVMEAPKTFIRESGVKKEIANEKETAYLEKARFWVYDVDLFMRMMGEVICPGCGENYCQDINSIDFKNGIVLSQCYMCEAKVSSSITPKSEVTTANAMKVISSSKIVEEVKKEEVKETISNSTNKSSINSEEENKMEEKIKLLEQEVAKVAEQLKAKDAEIATLKSQVEETNKKLEEANKQVEEANSGVEAVKKEKEEAVKVAKELATLVANRRAELGAEFSKDLSDEDIASDVKFENAKLKKENAELKAGKKVETKTSTENASLTVGAKETETEISAKRNRIREFAFPSNGKAE